MVQNEVCPDGCSLWVWEERVLCCRPRKASVDVHCIQQTRGACAQTLSPSRTWGWLVTLLSKPSGRDLLCRVWALWSLLSYLRGQLWQEGDCMKPWERQASPSLQGSLRTQGRCCPHPARLARPLREASRAARAEPQVQTRVGASAYAVLTCALAGLCFSVFVWFGFF